MEAVVWTVAYWVEAALRHSQDPPQAEREVARTHIRNAPAEVRTPLRDKVEEVFGQNELSDTALFVGDVEDWTFSRRGHLPRAPHRKMCADKFGRCRGGAAAMRIAGKGDWGTRLRLLALTRATATADQAAGAICSSLFSARCIYAGDVTPAMIKRTKLAPDIA